MLNPSELFINVANNMIAHWTPPGSPKDEFGHLIVGPRSLEDAKSALSEAINRIRSSAYGGFYRKRMLGGDLECFNSGCRTFETVQTERSEVAVVWHWPKPLQAQS